MEDSHRSEVDTSRPFRSVKEAIAIFNEHILSGKLHFPNYDHHHHHHGVVTTNRSPLPPPPPLTGSMGRLEAELEEMKKDVVLLKERDLEVEVVMTSLGAEIQKNASKLAEIEKCRHCRHELFEREERKTRMRIRKVKPIVPLVGDMFRSMKVIVNNKKKSFSTCIILN